MSTDSKVAYILILKNQVAQFKTLNRWFQSPLGEAVAQEFTNALKSEAHYLKGDILVQLGDNGTHPWLSYLNYKHKWVASPYNSYNACSMESALNHLPLPRNSVDCLVAPLTLEPFGSSFSLLDEIDRVLKPMGYIVLVGVNPWSLWGLGIKSGLVSGFDKASVKMRTPMHINRIFLQRGYTQCSLEHFCYIPPINNQKIINQLSFLHGVGKMLWPFPSGFYYYIAQKNEYGLTCIRTKSLKHLFTEAYKSPLQPVA